jgi:mono/diheme cytochrome c family protein
MRLPLIAPPLGAALLTLAVSATASEQDIRNNIALGALTFSDICAKCHQVDGYGEEDLYPSLHNPALLQNKTLLIQTILNGRTGHQQNVEADEITLMPALTFLSNAEIVAIIAFITNSWGGGVLVVTEQEVQEARTAMRVQEPGVGENVK